jgi:NAD(P)-dependent dehydrogenase (short-subunit alcohol dehydrogenase family)
MELTGKTALVTGADSDMGRVIAIAYGRAGADVAVNYAADPGAAEEIRREIEGIGCRSIAVKADITHDEAVRAMVHRIAGIFGKIDILVNCAGVRDQEAQGSTGDDGERVFSLDLRSICLVTLHSVPLMIKQRSAGIVNVAPVHKDLTRSYCTAKAGLAMLTEVMSTELAPHRISVNAITPGVGGEQSPGILQECSDEVPWNPAGYPDAVADLAVHLASQPEDCVTGATFVIRPGCSRQKVQQSGNKWRISACSRSIDPYSRNMI